MLAELPGLGSHHHLLRKLWLDRPRIEDEKMMGGPFKPSVGLSGVVSVDGIALQ